MFDHRRTITAVTSDCGSAESECAIPRIIQIETYILSCLDEAQVLGDLLLHPARPADPTTPNGTAWIGPAQNIVDDIYERIPVAPARHQRGVRVPAAQGFARSSDAARHEYVDLEAAEMRMRGNKDRWA
ncbi:hypothetical protein BFP70_13270 [Thioclava sp. SK-1]|uniref:hypothetical protein n=1 Tax=Thioclava sp. SK-1 TaxID=1889770 RepID=UPI000826D5DA|nr:hypothetical protein [Thioclava sp. SK-1]OCX63168.1 hypothetical protein BFP70_13270 [Thioclava sp. SK-1]